MKEKCGVKFLKASKVLLVDCLFWSILWLQSLKLDVVMTEPTSTRHHVNIYHNVSWCAESPAPEMSEPCAAAIIIIIGNDDNCWWDILGKGYSITTLLVSIKYQFAAFTLHLLFYHLIQIILINMTFNKLMMEKQTHFATLKVFSRDNLFYSFLSSNGHFSCFSQIKNRKKQKIISLVVLIYSLVRHFADLVVVVGQPIHCIQRASCNLLSRWPVLLWSGMNGRMQKKIYFTQVLIYLIVFVGMPRPRVALHNYDK